jgi:hypothetical protein
MLWCLATGFYAAEAITSILADPSGWGQTGAVFQQADCAPAVVMIEILPISQIPQESAGWWFPDHEIWLAEEYIATDYAPHMVNHEFGHELCMGHEGHGIMSTNAADLPWSTPEPTSWDIAAVEARITRAQLGSNMATPCPSIPGIR